MVNNTIRKLQIFNSLVVFIIIAEFNLQMQQNSD